MRTLPRPSPLLAICALAVASGATLLARHDRLSAAGAHPSAPAVDLLAAIPMPAGTSASDHEIRKRIELARRAPSDSKAWIALGDALMQKAREAGDPQYYDRAEPLYRRALTLDARSDAAMTGIAWVYGERHQFDQSIDWANRAVALAPRNQTAYGVLGDAEVERGEYDAAFEHYQRMLDIRPDISSYSRGAYLLYLTGNSRKAKWLMARAILAGAPYAENTAWCRTQLALILFNEGNFVAADQVLAEGLKTAPANRHMLAAMGRVQTARKNYRGAMDAYRRALAVYPDLNSMIALGDLYALTGDKAAAEKQYAAVQDLHARNTASGVHDHMLMAQFYADHDRNLVEALRLAEEHKDSKNVMEADTLAWCYYKNGQMAQAQRAIGRALRHRTPDARFLFHAGMIAAGLGHEAAARRYLYQALSLNPGFHPLYASRAADALKRMGQTSPWDRQPGKAVAAR